MDDIVEFITATIILHHFTNIMQIYCSSHRQFGALKTSHAQEYKQHVFARSVSHVNLTARQTRVAL